MNSKKTATVTREPNLITQEDVRNNNVREGDVFVFKGPVRTENGGLGQSFKLLGIVKRFYEPTDDPLREVAWVRIYYKDPVKMEQNKKVETPVCLNQIANNPIEQLEAVSADDLGALRAAAHPGKFVLFGKDLAVVSDVSKRNSVLGGAPKLKTITVEFLTGKDDGKMGEVNARTGKLAVMATSDTNSSSHHQTGKKSRNTA